MEGGGRESQPMHTSLQAKQGNWVGKISFRQTVGSRYFESKTNVTGKEKKKQKKREWEMHILPFHLQLATASMIITTIVLDSSGEMIWRNIAKLLLVSITKGLPIKLSKLVLLVKSVVSVRIIVIIAKVYFIRFSKAI